MHCRVPLHFFKTFFHLFFKSIQGNCFIYNVKFSGLNFPPNGPVMQKKTQGWEPNTERLFARDGMLTGNNFMALKLEGGGHYLCEFKSSPRFGQDFSADLFYCLLEDLKYFTVAKPSILENTPSILLKQINHYI